MIFKSRQVNTDPEPVNPILVKFRQHRNTYPLMHTHLVAQDWLDHFLNNDRNRSIYGFTTEQIDHARKVLTRLANLKK